MTIEETFYREIMDDTRTPTNERIRRAKSFLTLPQRDIVSHEFAASWDAYQRNDFQDYLDSVAYHAMRHFQIMCTFIRKNT